MNTPMIHKVKKTKVVGKYANGLTIKKALKVAGKWCYYDGKGNKISAEEYNKL